MTWETLDDAITYAHSLLRGEKVLLRETREADYEQLAAWWNDPTMRVFQTTWVRPQPDATVVEMMRGWNSNTGGDTGFAIESLADGALVGHVALFGIDKNRCATLGVLVGPPHWSAGLGSDALRVALRYGFAEHGLHRIQLEVFGYNVRAIAAYRKLGFVEEGTRRQAIYHAGQWHDAVQMGLLATEWHAHQT